MSKNPYFNNIKIEGMEEEVNKEDSTIDFEIPLPEETNEKAAVVEDKEEIQVPITQYVPKSQEEKPMEESNVEKVEEPNIPDIDAFMNSYKVSEEDVESYKKSVENLSSVQQSEKIVNKENVGKDVVTNPFADPNEDFNKPAKKVETPKSAEDDKPIIFEAQEGIEQYESTSNPVLNLFSDTNLDDLVTYEPAGITLSQRLKDLTDSTSTSSFQVSTVQSGYIARMSALKHSEVIKLLDTTADAHQNQLDMIKIVYDKITDTSVGKLTYDEFLELTSYSDFDHLLYGIYCQTYPIDNIIRIKCGKCDHAMDVSFDRNSIITVEPERQDDVFKRMNQILRDVRSLEELKKVSLISYAKKVRMPESKMVFKIKLPTLKQNLDLMKQIQQKALDEFGAATFNLINYIDSIAVPDLDASREKGQAVYMQVNTPFDIFNIISSLTAKDGKALNTAIDKMEEDYRVSYKLRSVRCNNCQTEITDTDVPIFLLLFQAMEK